MMDVELVQKVININTKLFELYVSSLFNGNYVYKETTSNNKILISFIRHYKLRVKDNIFLADYTERQFQYWLELYKTNSLKTNINFINISWVYGPKAIERFDEFLVYFNDKNYSKLIRKHVKSSQINKIIKIKKSKLIDISIPEEQEKQRYLNEPEGLEWCKTETTLINPLSKVCQNCRHKQECKQLLKINYPFTYEKRFE